ncbi:haloacid dehalogenase [Brachybacterium phenoliresistens]|uniref:Haloacid dehalogenase n=1 Tax=Brachybacterium phenoliresistens TaxID=396014 RepID=Z9JPC9_9MICO|nr:HAD family hydrolase [Brachybacterium phenoliresistens]EWS79597.1 haloacid dehalogenase [Brachybacterium phenoliresistens]
MSRPRLVASDLDGTLLGRDGMITERTARAWRDLWQARIRTVIVTARPPRWVDHLAAITGDHGIVICGNGAFLYDVAHRRILETHGMAPALVHELVADLRAIDGVSFSAELADGFHREDAYPAGTPDGIPEIGLERIGPLQDIGAPVGKLLARAPHRPAEEFLEEVAAIIGDRALLSRSCTGGLAEIGPADMTKARALETWCGQLGIDASEVWAFGDMPNDIPMLSWAGTGWAVANAHADVLAVADRVCGRHDEDGVAGALENLLAEVPAAS